ncbi:MAG TPA: dockerin type I repeat-containing protein [Planctomycetota bacterium]|jgi:hypothetical protein|nr:dockerin type I repeat-containing protein [Planctomycetota bacterium]OQC20308.1 MAG: hypothetical protein BWX69_01950 [Planctomycetes bacterium ADurb.Bin069]HNR98277.1 dockerin type I repeat-containing protein [Planctomycetota bacterium]HNU24855.1 dockerin type I repeat-containing protein [Planctomycetota bacterium]HOE29457.1 dockerin type I repeat-containing protein [Planctomycetota bacterium]
MTVRGTFLLFGGLTCIAAWAAAASSALGKPCAPLTPGSFRHRTKDLTRLVSGTPVAAEVGPLPLGVEAQIMLDSQFVIDVPAGAESLLFVLKAQDPREDNFDFAVRFGAPVAVTNGGASADYWVMFPTGYEELGLWGDSLAAGRWYAAIITRSPTGGKLTFEATIDGAFVDAAPNARTPVLVGAGMAATSPARRLDGQQYRLRTPADVLNLFVDLRAAEAGRDASFALRAGQPVGLAPDGRLVASRLIDADGGYGSACLEGAALAHDQLVYVWVVNSAETLLEADIAMAPGGCAQTLEPAASAQGFVARTPPGAPPGTVVLADARYIVSPQTASPAMCLHLEGLVPDGGISLSLFVRTGAPVALGLKNGAPALIFDGEFALAARPERFLIKPRCLEDQDLYIAVGNRGPTAGAYQLRLASAQCPFPSGRHPFRRGDANVDGQLDIADAVQILAYLFHNGTAPTCMDALDSDDNGRVDVADSITLLQYFFSVRRPPPAPSTTCGPDPTADELTCDDCRGCLPCVSKASP